LKGRLRPFLVALEIGLLLAVDEVLAIQAYWDEDPGLRLFLADGSFRHLQETFYASVFSSPSSAADESPI